MKFHFLKKFILKTIFKNVLIINNKGVIIDLEKETFILNSTFDGFGLIIKGEI